MKSSRKVAVAKKYGLGYKKKPVTTDPYFQKGSAGKVAVCEGCHAVYRNKRWYVEEVASAAVLKSIGALSIVCPACLKIRDNFPSGIVTLKGEYVLSHKHELLNLIRNEEERARGFNPLERVMSIKENGYGSIVVSTTNEKLAQRLGRAIKKAFHGEVAYHWSHDTKLVRVEWERA